jgi:AcrR family transcriptional regulator
MSSKSANTRTAKAVSTSTKLKSDLGKVAKPKTIAARVAKKLGAVATAAAQGSVRRVRSNKRSEATIVNILAATENIVLESGAERISILDVCRAANVSRGTFYRYFASQDELLDAFSRHKRERFHVALAEAVESYQDPDERFAALVRYLDHYLEHGRARRLLTVAPEYALGFFRRIFHDSVVRFQDVLAIVFDAWEARLGIKLDRELVCELLIRYVLSEQMVPSDSDRKTLPRRIARMVESLTTGTSSRSRR